MLRAILAFTLLPALSAIAAPTQVTGVEVVPRDGSVDVVVRASSPLTFQTWSKSSPPVIVLDLLDADAAALSKAAQGLVRSIDVTRHDGRGGKLSRVSIALAERAEYDVVGRGNDVVVTLSRLPSGLPTLEATPGHRVAMRVPSDSAEGAKGAGIVEGFSGRATATDFAQAGPRRQMTYIGFRNTSAASVVFARLNDQAEYSVRKEGDNLIVLEIRNATIPLRNNRNHLDTTYFDSPVKMITPSEIDDATPTIRIAIEMRSAVPYEASIAGSEIRVTFKK